MSQGLLASVIRALRLRSADGGWVTFLCRADACEPYTCTNSCLKTLRNTTPLYPRLGRSTATKSASTVHGMSLAERVQVSDLCGCMHYKKSRIEKSVKSLLILSLALTHYRALWIHRHTGVRSLWAA